MRVRRNDRSTALTERRTRRLGGPDSESARSPTSIIVPPFVNDNHTDLETFMYHLLNIYKSSQFSSTLLNLYDRLLFLSIVFEPAVSSRNPVLAPTGGPHEDRMRYQSNMR